MPSTLVLSQESPGITVVIDSGTPGVVVTREESTGVVVTSATTPGPQGPSGVNNLATSGKGFINHAVTAGATRPTGYASIEWYGSAQPVNAVVGDTWIDTS